MRKKMLFNYKKGIHPECGKKIKVYKDILMTPFYTENFCDELVKMSKEYKDKFSPDIVYGKSDSHKMTEDYPWDTLFFSKISYFLHIIIFMVKLLLKKYYLPSHRHRLVYISFLHNFQ